MTRVDLVLSIYKGRLFIEELLASLANQDFSNFKIILRFDSYDSMLNMKEISPQLNFVECKHLNEKVGVSRSYLHLLTHSNSNLTFFCDQDDVWKKNKISTFVEIASSLQSSQAFLIASRLEILMTEKLWPKKTPNLNWVNALFENPLAGCSMAINDKLRELMISNPMCSSILHDELAYLLCAFGGEIFYVDEPLISYRIHDNNATGIDAIAKFMSFRYLIRIRKLSKLKKNVHTKLLILNALALPTKVDQKMFISLFSHSSFCQRFRYVRKVILFRQNRAEDVFVKMLWVLGYFQIKTY